MAKLAQNSTKYLIKATFNAKGIVERPDVIGAIFGQTEGLLGPELDLRELQRTGKIGRVEVTIKTEKGKTSGEVTIPSSLDAGETALIAASIETIDRIGPCDAKIKIESVNDLRTVKRQYIIDRAKSVLSELLYQVPDINSITEELLQSVRSAEITEYEGLPAGPDIITSEDIIICEGRADVVNLLKHGIKNAIAVGGTAINPKIIGITKEKEVTVFLDGDRGGDLILKSLQDMGAEIDFVARAPKGKEVEELTKKEVFKALRDKIHLEQSAVVLDKDKKDREDKKLRQHKVIVKDHSVNKQQSKQGKGGEEIPEEVSKIINEQKDDMIGSRAAVIYDKDLQFIGRIPAKELTQALKNLSEAELVFLDSDLTYSLLKLMSEKGIEYVYTTKKPSVKSKNIKIIFDE